MLLGRNQREKMEVKFKYMEYKEFYEIIKNEVMGDFFKTHKPVYLKVWSPNWNHFGNNHASFEWLNKMFMTGFNHLLEVDEFIYTPAEFYACLINTAQQMEGILAPLIKKNPRMLLESVTLCNNPFRQSSVEFYPIPYVSNKITLEDIGNLESTGIEFKEMLVRILNQSLEDAGGDVEDGPICYYYSILTTAQQIQERLSMSYIMSEMCK